MFLRFVYGLCVLTFLVSIGYKAWQGTPLSPYVVVEAREAHAHHLDGKDVVVAIIDEGFDPSHSSLKDHFSAFRYNTNHKRSQDISETLIFENGKYTFESHG